MPQHIDSIKEDEAAVKAYGVQMATNISKQLLAAGAPVLHYYSLNLDNPTVAGFGLHPQSPMDNPYCGCELTRVRCRAAVLESLGRANPPAPAAASYVTTTTITHPDGTSITTTTKKM